MTYALHSELERLILGANSSLELGQADVPTWFAGELGKIYPRYESTKDVRVTVSGKTITVERPNGVPRALVIGEHRGWELGASATGSGPKPHAVNAPGQLATILSDP